MSVTFPSLIQWNSAYSVDIATIDSQHKMLVSMIRQLQEGMMTGRAKEYVAPLIGIMTDYTNYHFTYEEKLLEQHGYANLAAHRQEHAGLITQLQEIKEKYASGRLQAGAPLLHFLRNWLLDHICLHDMAYAGFLKEKGVS